MNKTILRSIAVVALMLLSIATYAQEGKCGDKIKWTFDGMELKLTYEGSEPGGEAIYDYDMKNNLAPWNKKKLSGKIRKIHIGRGINRVGSCAFYNCSRVNSVEFEGYTIKSIGWGAFYGCSSLLNFYFPANTGKIERLAFACCTKLGAVEIPENCTVEDHAFMSCPNITNIIVPANAHIGEYAFISEININGKRQYALYNAHIDMLPSYITEANSKKYGLSPQSVAKYLEDARRDNRRSDLLVQVDEYEGTSDVDSLIPETGVKRNNTFALIIGNEDYSQLHAVPFAKADAHVFRDYCTKTLGIPTQNIMYSENSTLNKMKRDLKWLGERVAIRKESDDNVNVIVYYAGHGMPDESTRDAYLLPTDGYASDVSTGMPLSEFYLTLEGMKAANVTVFLDACFSGSQRDGAMLASGLRGVAVRPKEVSLGGNMVVFSAAQGDETAQPYTEKGHGLFTYFLLKKLQESQGQIDYGHLSDFINHNVREKAIEKGKSQTPATSTSPNAAEIWRQMWF